MSAEPKHKLTFAEYLEIERQAEVKSEFYDGEMFLMAGAKPDHNRIVRNVLTSLHLQTQDSNCEAFRADQLVQITSLDKGCYPDISVVCGEQQFDETEYALINPILIIEVLSDTTESYDRGRKFEDYQLLELLAEYILISQKSYRLEQFIRQDAHTWIYHEYRNAEDVIQLENINCTLSLKEVYLNVA